MKCHKEEAPTWVIVASMQYVKGTLLSWSPYFLNVFLDDWKEAQDLRMEFNYSWMIILIALVGLIHPKYSILCQRTRKCHATQVESLWTITFVRQMKTNSRLFTKYMEEIQEKVEKT